MESLSRQRHGRKHSSAGNALSSASSPSLSMNDPYEDVSLSNGGKSKFAFHEYAEIFSASSSIPVLDLSSLDERVGSREVQSSRLDYSNIFGGVRNDEVAVPYEELLTGAAKKIKMQVPSKPCPESGSFRPSGKTKRSSGEAIDQSSDGFKQQLNMSFNKVSPRESDEPNGKTHVAQFNDVPGFTCFVDGTPQPEKKEVQGPVSPLKREVSRTWSFSVGAGDGLTCEKPHILDKSGNVNEINLKSCNAEVLSPSSHPCNPFGESDPKGSRFQGFDSRDGSKSNAGGYSLPMIDEELDETSVAAVSAAALKKAVEQAQESIRIARMIMERKKENLQGASKPRLKGHLKVKDKNKNGIENEVDASIEKNTLETFEGLDNSTIVTGINGKFIPSFKDTGKFLDTGKAEVERVSAKVEEAKELGASSEMGKTFSTLCDQSGTFCNAEKFALETVETAGACRGENNIVGLAANGESRVEALETEKVDNHDKVMCSTDKRRSHLEDVENATGKFEQLAIHQSEGGEAVTELTARPLSPSKSVQETGKTAEDSLLQLKGTVDDITRAEDIIDSSGVLDSSQSMQHREKNELETSESLCIVQEEGLTEERDDLVDSKAEHEKKVLGHKEMIFGKHLTAQSVFNNLLKGFRSMAEENMLRLEDMESNSETCPELKGNEQHGKTNIEEEWLGSEQQDGRIVNVDHEPEIKGKIWNSEHDLDGRKSPRDCEQSETVDKQVEPSKSEVAETIQVQVNNFAEVVCDAERKIDDIHGEPGQSEDLEDKFNLTGTAENDIGEAVSTCDIDFGPTSCDNRSNDSSDITGDVQEPCDVDSNDKVKECCVAVRDCKESVSSIRVTNALSSDEDSKTGNLFHREAHEVPGTDSLRRCASEENFIGSKLSTAFEGFSSDSSTENSDLIYADHVGKLPRPSDMFTVASKVKNGSQEAEFDDTIRKPGLEQSSDSTNQNIPTSILEGTNEASAPENQEFAENADENTSKKEVKHSFDIISDGRENVEEQRQHLYSKWKIEDAYSPPIVESEEIEMEAKREVEKDQDVEKESHSECSTTRQKDTRATWQKVEENDRQQRIEAIKKGREREKDRKAVERAIREARERAFAEAREKAERAAAEARQRAMAEAQEKLEKPSILSKQSSDKLSTTEAKIRAERAAVERATAEARERALEKVRSQKTYTEARTQAERYSTERLSSSSRDKGLKHSFSSSDLEKFYETTSESAQRRKARLERHQRIMERAAKALAEKNKRDLLAQKEQAEKNRLAETLDAEIKRWATGKEGNLRALLSTLQYILGPDSGWQPTSLTEIITTAAVKKAYRKATLCVHPDKLQQRGATIQQKYICEKVFDLLKAAWNRFNSEEN
ncbi:auxilin-like protein 1 [Andrographis paniculata]|uniref:auxilin-like protein 1 n=1 Tax=Andrographis paniculata TaxID=175694 RepID=UPI0021E8BE88|nr:auxilin-like protein 1 [Andrographis paniculata]